MENKNKELAINQECFEMLRKYVPTKYFMWAMTLFTLVIGWQFSLIYNLESKVMISEQNNTVIATQLAQIQTDLQWIKRAIEDDK